VALVNVRMDGVWGDGVFLVLSALGCALLGAMGWLAPLEGERPRSYQSTLLLLGLALLLIALLRLAQVLGVGAPLRSAGTVVWVFGLLAAAAIACVRSRRAAICALVAAVGGSIALLALVEWVFEPHGVTTFRWVLLAIAVAFVFGSLRLRESHRRESVYLVDAAGLAVIAIALTAPRAYSYVPAGDVISSPGDLGTWWEIVLLAAAFGLAAFSGVDRERGPGFLAALALVIFVALAGRAAPAGASLVGWPLLLLLVGGIALVAGLRPRRELPPEPGPHPPEPDPSPPTALRPKGRDRQAESDTGSPEGHGPADAGEGPQRDVESSGAADGRGPAEDWRDWAAR